LTRFDLSVVFRGENRLERKRRFRRRQNVLETTVRDRRADSIALFTRNEFPWCFRRPPYNTANATSLTLAATAVAEKHGAPADSSPLAVPPGGRRFQFGRFPWRYQWRSRDSDQRIADERICTGPVTRNWLAVRCISTPSVHSLFSRRTHKRKSRVSFVPFPVYLA